MKYFFIILLSIFFSKNLKKEVFYNAFSNNSISEINELIKSLKEHPTGQNNAYLGALLMKKSNFEKDIKQKIKLFKEGAKFLETEIEKDGKNIEYRFIRLIIQENAPKILKYNSNIEEDKKMLVDNFEKLTPFLQKHIKEYSKKSDVLRKW